MPRPGWLDERREQQSIRGRAHHCWQCEHHGSEQTRLTRHCGKEWVRNYRCLLHPKVECNVYDLACEDWQPRR